MTVMDILDKLDISCPDSYPGLVMCRHPLHKSDYALLHSVQDSLCVTYSGESDFALLPSMENPILYCRRLSII
jgi:hypothetical protein